MSDSFYFGRQILGSRNMARYIKMKNVGFNKVAVVADDGKSPGAHSVGQWDSCT